MPIELFAQIYIDIMHMPLISQGHYKYIVAARDDLPGGAEGKGPERGHSQQTSQVLLGKYLLSVWNGISGNHQQ